MKRFVTCLTSLALCALCTFSVQASQILSDGDLSISVEDTTGSLESVVFNGYEFYNAGYPTVGYGFQTGSDTSTFALNDPNTGFFGIPAAASTIGSTIQVVGSYGALEFTRTYTLSGGNTINITTTLTNTGADSLNVLYFDTADPDQDPNTSATVNDVTGSSMSAAGGAGGTTTWSTANPAVLSFVPFSLQVVDGDTLNSIFSSPYDPDGAVQDIGMSIIFDLTLGAGESTTVAYTQTFTPGSVPEPGSLTLLGLGLAGIAGVAVRRRRSR